jgi:1-acyl-sn-glycerol-3-phosphate acyltransferase
MNRQPYQTPPQWWAPQMNPFLVRLFRRRINRTLQYSQKIASMDVQGCEHVRRAIEEGAGVLVTPNHSFHYDSYVLIEAAHRVGRPFHFMTAWQVFQMSTAYERWVLQVHGCFSINREANDLQAFKQGIEILRESEHPLAIFPEGDIYHHNDRVKPFRDGAAAIAMSAAKKGPRKIVVIPCALKAFYTQDPSAELEALMTRLEESLHWRPRKHCSLSDRLYKFAEAILALKEIEYLGRPHGGSVVERSNRLALSVLDRLETKHGVTPPTTTDHGMISERVKELRRAVIKATEQEGLTPADRQSLHDDMEDLFFVIQLFSYPGDYVAERPTIERIAETFDKFEEDLLHLDFPGIRGERRVVVRFGEPLVVPAERSGRDAVAQWTDMLEKKVQGLLDDINREQVSLSNLAAG